MSVTPMPVIYVAASILLLSHAPIPLSQETEAACRQSELVVCAGAAGGNGGGGAVGGTPVINCQPGSVCNFPNMSRGGDGGAGGSATGDSSDNSDQGDDTSSTSTVRCEMTISDDTFVDSRKCTFIKEEDRFTLKAKSVTGQYSYKAVVIFNDDGTGAGYLSGGRSSRSRELGLLSRDGACWTDGNVNICAWK